ncbi:MAG: hypothetical protein LBR22_07260 [Desulfovibrio sp.]|jgi:hypothetical protein|nr:hypothetical protein [Desulfovibrio sp.]
MTIFGNPILDTAVLAFFGGVFGTAIGGLWVFVLDTLLVLLGCIMVASGGSDILLTQFALGPVFGPQSTFLGGAVAASYAAAIKKNHPGGTGAGKDIVTPLLDTSWDVYAVGGLAAVACALLATAGPYLPILKSMDGLAGPIIIVSLVARFIIHREAPWGKMESIKKLGWLGTDGYKISWAGCMSPPMRLLFVGASVGCLAGVGAMHWEAALKPLVVAGTITPSVAYLIPYIFFWGVSGVMLTALQLGTGNIQKIPITHAMSVLAAAAYLGSHSIPVAILGGIFGAFLEEFCARGFYNHGSDHVDPPAFAIALGTLTYSFIF